MHGLTWSNTQGELRSAGGWQDAVAIHHARGGIKAAKVGMKSASNLLEFLVTQKTGASPAEYAIFLQV
jgi:hypothetical protein